MFTGIIQEIGVIDKAAAAAGGFRFRITAKKSAPRLRVNDSVSINGVCHTVVRRSKAFFEVQSVEETLKKTSIGLLKKNCRVNLELPLGASGRFDGHIVLGHVDCVGSIKEILKRKNSWLFTVAIPEKYSKYVVGRGSVAIDGVSLTLAKVVRNRLVVSIIPHTMNNTIFLNYNTKSKVNIEFDIVGKYIERMMFSRR